MDTNNELFDESVRVEKILFSLLTLSAFIKDSTIILNLCNFRHKKSWPSAVFYSLRFGPVLW